MKAWLRRNFDYIKKAKWVNGRMGSDNVNVWWRNGRLKILRGCIEG